MDKKIYYILGTIFIITSGFFYTFERVITPSISGQIPSSSQAGNASTATILLHSSPFSNLFIAAFIVIGVIFFASGYAKND